MTNITKLRSFQYRLLHRSLTTNMQLQHWNIKPTAKCTFCETEDETVLHLFLFCLHVTRLWMEIENFIMEFSKYPIHFNTDTVLWNRLIHSPIGHVKNVICLITKHYIYKQRCLNKKPNVTECKQYVRTIENNEKYYTVKNNKLAIHRRKWRPDQRVENMYNIDQYINEYLCRI